MFEEDRHSPPSLPRMAAQIAQSKRLLQLDPMCSTGLHRWEDCQGSCALKRGKEYESLIREPIYFDEGTARSEKSASIA